jgi:F-type H+-transporting ATPase subunit a
MNCKRLFSLLVLSFALFGASFFAVAQSEGNGNNTDQKGPVATEAGKKEEGGKLDVSKVIFGHIADAHEWHVCTIKHEGGEPTHISMPLPVILYHPANGFSFFSSSNFGEVHKNADGKELTESYKGYHIQKDMMKEHIISEDGAKIYDLSITKNVLSMLVSVALLLWLMMGVGKKYKTNGAMKAPSGFQNFLEIVVIFIRDEVAKPCLGKKYLNYMPLLLTIFFFIWLNNLLGLLPIGGANLTGNIAVTGCLALLAFIVILANSKKDFWMHLINPPGVPLGIKFLLVPIEIVSLFIKPMALMIRLFANIMAGHIVILALICIVFIFAAINTYVGVGFVPVSLAFSIFMFALELLVGAIQAFIFVNLTAVFIGQGLEGSHEEHGPHAEIII